MNENYLYLMIENIPIYRLLLNPESYLLGETDNKAIEEIICDLPNSQNKYRLKELKFLPKEFLTHYYNNELLLETKIFTREMLHICKVKTNINTEICNGNNLHAILKIIEDNRVIFLKNLILNHLIGLFKGHLKKEIISSNSVEEIKHHLKKYGVYSKLFIKLNTEYQRLKNIYC